MSFQIALSSYRYSYIRNHETTTWLWKGIPTSFLILSWGPSLTAAITRALVSSMDITSSWWCFLFEISKTSLNVSKLRCNRVSRPHPNSSFKLSTVYWVFLPSWRRRGNRFSSSLSSSRASPFLRRLLRFPLALTFFWNKKSSSGTNLSKAVFNLLCVRASDSYDAEINPIDHYTNWALVCCRDFSISPRLTRMASIPTETCMARIWWNLIRCEANVVPNAINFASQIWPRRTLTNKRFFEYASHALAHCLISTAALLTCTSSADLIDVVPLPTLRMLLRL